MNHDSAYFKRVHSDIKCLVVPPTIKVSALNEFSLLADAVDFSFFKDLFFGSGNLIHVVNKEFFNYLYLTY